jgi:hypothetical protein
MMHRPLRPLSQADHTEGYTATSTAGERPAGDRSR